MNDTRTEPSNEALGVLWATTSEPRAPGTPSRPPRGEGGRIADDPAATSPPSVPDSDELLKAANRFPDILCVLDEKGRFVWTSRAVEALWGFRPDQLEGCPFDEVIHPDDLERTRGIGTDLLEGRASSSFENRCLHRNGEVRFMLWSASWSEEDRKFYAVARDVTDERSDEERSLRSQRLESLGSLSSGVAHDLANVFGPIEMVLATLEAGEEVESELLQVARRSLDRGTKLVRQIVSFARGFEGQRRRVDPNEALGELHELLRGILPRNIELVLEKLDEERGLEVDVDPTRLQQILLNLAVNSRDAMPEGGRLGISATDLCLAESLEVTSGEIRPGDYLVFEVTDTGNGIEESALERIFEPFFSTKGIDRGSGLGLATCRSIAEGYGGGIDVDSALGDGTAIRVFLPLVPPKSGSYPAVSGPTAGGGRPDTSAEGSRDLGSSGDGDESDGDIALVVDDDEGVRIVLSRQLQRLGLEVLATGDGREALELCSRETRIGLVLVDVRLSEIAGHELIGRMRRRLPDVKVIAMSGLDEEQDEVQRCDADAFLAKPFDLVRLQEALAGASGG